MSQYRRGPYGRPYGSGSQPRLMTSVLLLIIVSMIYTTSKDARNWKWLEVHADEIDNTKPATNPKPREWKEVVIEAPHDGDPEELATCRMQLGAVQDKTPLDGLDMPSYYRLLKWARAQPFEALEVRARREIFYRQFFESAKTHRGNLQRLRLHVRQIVVHDDLPQNSSEARKVYELWAYTDESKSHPYVVVVPEIPSWFKTGPEVDEECVFVGYFLKIMAYEAVGAHRGAPLLVGRLRPVSGPPKKAAAAPAIMEYALGAGVLAVFGAIVWFALKSRRPVSLVARVRKSETDGVSDWLSPEVSVAGQLPSSTEPPAIAPAVQTHEPVEAAR